MRDRIAASAFLVVQFERPLSLVARRIAFAREHGVTTVLTPAPVQPVETALLRLVDILVLNEAEACELAGVPDVQDAAARLSPAIRHRHRDAGRAGRAGRPRGAPLPPSSPLPRRERWSTPPARVTPSSAPWSRGSALGDGFDDALAGAVAAAAISVTRPGASSSMPTWAEVEALPLLTLSCPCGSSGRSAGPGSDRPPARSRSAIATPGRFQLPPGSSCSNSGAGTPSASPAPAT